MSDEPNPYRPPEAPIASADEPQGDPRPIVAPSRFRWRIIPAMLSAIFGLLFLVVVGLNVIQRLDEAERKAQLRRLGGAPGLPIADQFMERLEAENRAYFVVSRIFITLGGIAGIWAAFRWMRGRWRSAVALSVAMFALLFASETLTQPLIRLAGWEAQWGD